MQAGKKKKMWQRPGWGWTVGKGFHRVEAKPKPKPLPKKLTKAETIAINLKAYQDKMNNAKPTTPPAPRISSEVAALNSHLDLINSIPQPGAPEGIAVPAELIPSPLGPVGAQGPISPAGEPGPEESPFITDAPELSSAPDRVKVEKLFLTGRLKSGKDYVAAKAGAVIFGFADPIYVLATHYLGVTVNATEGKDIPGVRAFLQTVGQWGRGVVNEAYPMSVTRALFGKQLQRDLGDGVFSDMGVDWTGYGKDPNIWLNSCIVRANAFLATNPGVRIAITNCRFGNEFQRLQAEGFEHYHCMTSPKTWATRLAESKLTPESPSVRDTSEQLAAKLDQSVIKQLSAQKAGPMLKAIWSDPTVPKPSQRLHTVESFLQAIGGAQ